jgi:hypothetical protein
LDYESRVRPKDADPSRHGVRLLAWFCFYAAANFVVVRMAMNGALSPPWDLLFFFSFIGPLVGIVVVLGVYFLSGRRLFRGRWVTWVIFALLAAGWINYRILWEASASV